MTLPTDPTTLRGLLLYAAMTPEATPEMVLEWYQGQTFLDQCRLLGQCAETMISDALKAPEKSATCVGENRQEYGEPKC